MREGWEYKKLGQVCTSDLGKTLNKSKDRGELHPYLCSINILWDKIDLSTLKQACFEADEQEKYSVRKGDLLVCEGGDTGRSAIWDRDETILYQNALHRLRFHESVSPKFVLFYLLYLKDIGEIDNKYSKGVTIKHLVKKALLSIPLPIPPKSTQLSIVSELDKINELIWIKKEQLKDYDTLAQSIFYEMFGDPVENEKGWEVKKFGEIGTLERGAGISKKDFVDDGLPCIHYGQLHTIFGAYTRKNITFIPKDLLPKYKIAHSGDLILAITSEDVEGSCKSTAWLGNFDVVVGSDAAIFHHNQNGIYLSYYTRTKAFYNEKAKYAKGFKVTHISTKEIASISICIPPISIQNTFANKIEQIEKQKAIIQKIIMDLETLLASRMQYWFD
ncbi:restriction endonuclease subunit S [Prevotella melaninogenica]|uniref:restriction endonuclease subunit S n=1 Tax=Prevotella melaninogenica TaxID=28132 RepID=UPI001C5D21E4|nr:restriction endonuclease subunit S [Prevotella melaninogenica]MBW4724476.1 restriction endonuclease subunit S [Prevotella melaninogenica]